MFYFVGVGLEKNVKTTLVSIFQKDLLEATITLRHWSGRNSRGVTQFNGAAVAQLIEHPASAVKVSAAESFLKHLIEL